MNRACERLPAVDVAHQLLTPRMRERVGCDLFIGADPVFAGLHDFETVVVQGVELSYRDKTVNHVVWRICVPARKPRSDIRTTAVFPALNRVEGRRAVRVVLHELGHVLEESVDWDYPAVAEPVTSYAEANHHEAFAEAFAMWALPAELDAAVYPRWPYPPRTKLDPGTVHLFGGALTMIPQPWPALILALATFRAARFVGWDDWPPVARLRAWLIGEHWVPVEGEEPTLPGKTPSSEVAEVRPAYRRPTLAHGIHCPYCQGAWCSLAVYLLWLWKPHWIFYWAAPAALSGVVGIVARNLDP